jgi:GT2 family glycosyltransferase
MSTIPVTVVVVTFSSRETIGDALEGLRPGNESGLLNCVVVDNNSSDGTADLVAATHPWVRLIRSPQNLGYGRGCNLGFEGAETPYVLFMNPDVRLEAEALQGLVGFMEGHPRAGVAAPCTRFGGNRYQEVGGLPTPWSLLAHAAGWPHRERKLPLLPGSAPFTTDWLCGAILLVRSSLFRELGGFDRRFFLYFEETDLCRRIAEAGFELWAVGSVEAIHSGGHSAQKVDPSIRAGGCIASHFFPSRYYYISKHHGFVAAMATEASELVFDALRDVGRLVLGRPKRGELRSRLRAPVFTCPPKLL